MSPKNYSVFGLSDGPKPKKETDGVKGDPKQAEPAGADDSKGSAEASPEPTVQEKKKAPRRKPRGRVKEQAEAAGDAPAGTSASTPKGTQKDASKNAERKAEKDAAPAKKATDEEGAKGSAKPRSRRAPRKPAKPDQTGETTPEPRTAGSSTPETGSQDDVEAQTDAPGRTEPRKATPPPRAAQKPPVVEETTEDGGLKNVVTRKNADAPGTADPKSAKDSAAAAEDAPESLPGVTIENLSENQQAACARAGWDSLMPVQERAIPYLAKGRDIMVQARTGSGKTGAFVLPLLDILDKNLAQCQALILVPTRELAQQVAREATMLAGSDSIRVVAAYGGVGYKEQLDAFRQGAHLVVGTPGRVLDHLMRRTLTLDHLKVLIFDEADRMLSVGFYPDMKAIQRYLTRKLHGCYMFSATYPYTVLRLADEFLRDPELLSLSAEQVHVTDIDHQFCQVPSMGKERRLVRLIELENPSSAIIFCNTKRNVEFVAAVLQRFGYDAEELSSSLSQAKREQVLGRIREGRLRFLVATDVAARGIDIPELSHVFLYEPPEDPESYIHRAGRTGRAGASGTVISLVDLVQKAALQRIGTRYGIDLVERKEPEEADVIEVVEQRLTVLLEKKRREVDKIQEERITRFHPLARKLAEDDDTLMLLGMFLDELYQASLQTTAQPLGGGKKPAEAAKSSGGGRGGRGSRSGGPDRGRRDGDRDAPTRPEKGADRAAAPAAAQASDEAGEDGEQPRKRKRRPRRRGKRGGGPQKDSLGNE